MQPVPNASSLSTWAEAENVIDADASRAEALYFKLVDDQMFALASRLRLSLIAQRGAPIATGDRFRVRGCRNRKADDRRLRAGPCPTTVASRP